MKVPGGKLLKVTCETENKMIQSVKISGDFFLHPEESIVILEKNLAGASIDKGSISKIVGEFIQKGNIFIGIEGLPRTDADIPPAGLAIFHAVITGGMMISRQGMADQDGIGFVGIEFAIGLEYQVIASQFLAAAQRQGLIETQLLSCDDADGVGWDGFRHGWVDWT